MRACGMDGDAPRGRLRRWTAIFAALLGAGAAWIRRALLRHFLFRRAASAADKKEDRKRPDGVRSKNRPPPTSRRRNLDGGDIGSCRTRVGDIGERRNNVADIENRGAASRAAAAAHSVPQLVSKNAEPPARPTPAAPSATSRAAATHSAHQLDSKNAEPLARPVLVEPLDRLAQAAPSTMTDSTRHSKNPLALPVPAATRPVPRQKKRQKKVTVPRQPHQWAETDETITEDETDETITEDEIEMMRHQLYHQKAKACRKNFIYCLICYLEKNKETRLKNDDSEITSHNMAVHKRKGVPCQKTGCLVRGLNNRQIGLHQYVCHKMT